MTATELKRHLTHSVLWSIAIGFAAWALLGWLSLSMSRHDWLNSNKVPDGQVLTKYDPSVAGQLADALGASNGLFSAITVFLVALSIHYQTKELSAQHDEIRESMEEQRKAAVALREQAMIASDQLTLQQEIFKEQKTRADEQMNLMSRSLDKTAESLDVARQQTEVAEKSSAISAMGVLASALIEACPDRSVVRAEFQNLLSLKQDKQEERVRTFSVAQGLEQRAAIILFQLQELAVAFQKQARLHDPVVARTEKRQAQQNS